MMPKNSIFYLKEKASQIRTDIINMTAAVGKCHLAGPLSSVDLITALYFSKILKYDAKNPLWDKRDRFILSCGHYAPVWYSVLARVGYFNPKELINLRQIESFLQGHPSCLHSNFVEVSTGSLGQGLSVGVGMALGLKLRNTSAGVKLDLPADSESHDSSEVNRNNIWVLTSDAEYQEGQTWEAIMSGSKFRLGNLKVIVDTNGIQIDGLIKDLMPLGNLVTKLENFGWTVFSIDGHDMSQIIGSYQTALEIRNKPVAIVAKTIAGKGVSFIEGKWQWHDGELTKEQLKTAIRELGEIDSENFHD
ncbi:MAG TPA: transketolase [Candidatus Bathyarchaeia archaeon]|nr:transketolase [Candidatus Bathyarchaeia archaeon]